MTATTEIMLSVNSLDVPSHSVKLCDGIKLDGMIIGKRATPAVVMMLAIDKLEEAKAKPARLSRVITAQLSIPMIPSAGIAKSIG